ncbi:hypothetical protein BVG16_31090 [Paenibacillus selenitireducens]|uniref:DUF3298 domain-containing protein n=1 Tax=Paenibacillus selenitireducens TaxID=1324314 RepID=A0A1T2WZF4_9BACL|nr:hypothetical protein [Paenibacillus selenitireducens]OPA73004.1 hypothetical protein BVG16_31090 [Paenibacillus selenitireducens]
MNKLIRMVIGAAFLMMSLTGCEGIFNGIAKDKVIVKKITKEPNKNEVQYEGVLSQDAVKTVSLNAVNKYYDTKLTIDEVQFGELLAVDQVKLKDLLDRVEKKYKSHPRVREMFTFKMDAEAELKKIPSGLFYVTLIHDAGFREAFDIVINASDGEVLRINHVEQSPVVYNDVISDPLMDEIHEVANRFIQEKMNEPLSQLTFDKKQIRWDYRPEVYYLSKTNQMIKYSVQVQMGTKQVAGFSKDVMALLQYYTES